MIHLMIYLFQKILLKYKTINFWRRNVSQGKYFMKEKSLFYGRSKKPIVKYQC